MMYTKGVRKIFTCKNVKKSLEQHTELAEAGGFDALTFNGKIQVRVEVKIDNVSVGYRWVETCFHITDFSDEQV